MRMLGGRPNFWSSLSACDIGTYRLPSRCPREARISRESFQFNRQRNQSSFGRRAASDTILRIMSVSSCFSSSEDACSGGGGNAATSLPTEAKDWSSSFRVSLSSISCPRNFPFLGAPRSSAICRRKTNRAVKANIGHNRLAIAWRRAANSVT